MLPICLPWVTLCNTWATQLAWIESSQKPPKSSVHRPSWEAARVVQIKLKLSVSWHLSLASTCNPQAWLSALQLMNCPVMWLCLALFSLCCPWSLIPDKSHAAPDLHASNNEQHGKATSSGSHQPDPPYYQQISQQNRGSVCVISRVEESLLGMLAFSGMALICARGAKSRARPVPVDGRCSGWAGSGACPFVWGISLGPAAVLPYPSFALGHVNSSN